MCRRRRCLRRAENHQVNEHANFKAERDKQLSPTGIVISLILNVEKNSEIRLKRKRKRKSERERERMESIVLVQMFE